MAESGALASTPTHTGPAAHGVAVATASATLTGVTVVLAESTRAPSDVVTRAAAGRDTPRCATLTNGAVSEVADSSPLSCATRLVPGSATQIVPSGPASS